jgi:uncharacterized membrane protein YczE
LRLLFLFSGLALLTFGVVLAIHRKYAIQLLLCLLSCLITAFGVCLVVKGNLVFLVGEGLYQAFAIRFSFNFGSCKTYGDIILVLIAVVSASLCLDTIIGGAKRNHYDCLMFRQLSQNDFTQTQFYSL